jgi:hypothetical protein
LPYFYKYVAPLELFFGLLTTGDAFASAFLLPSSA